MKEIRGATSVCEKCKISSFTLCEAMAAGRLKYLTSLFCSGLLEITTLESICPLLITDSKLLLSSLKWPGT